MKQEVRNKIATVRKIKKQYYKAQIDYGVYFLSLYISYNAWYYQVTSTTNDRQALNLLKRRYVLWGDYCKGRVLRALNPYMQQLAELTQREPFINTVSRWDGEIENSYDWRSLIEYWYQVRCSLVHGSEVRGEYVWLAYQTLRIFMEEIVCRMEACIIQIEKRIETAHFSVPSSSIFQVDMHHV